MKVRREREQPKGCGHSAPGLPCELRTLPAAQLSAPSQTVNGVELREDRLFTKQTTIWVYRAMSDRLPGSCKHATSVHRCRLLPLFVQPRYRISVALGRGPILVQVILIQVRLKEREGMSLNRGQGFVMGCRNPAVKTWDHGENPAGASYRACRKALLGVCSPSHEIEPAREPSA